MENLDFSEEEIQEQLAVLGYTNITKERLREFKQGGSFGLRVHVNFASPWKHHNMWICVPKKVGFPDGHVCCDSHADVFPDKSRTFDDHFKGLYGMCH